MLLINLVMASLLIQPGAGQIEVRQSIVDHRGEPLVQYPYDMTTRLSARCPQGWVEFFYSDLLDRNRPRIECLSVGRTVFDRRQLRVLEELFSGLTVERSSIGVCRREEDRRIQIFVRFGVSARTPEESLILAVIYVDERGVFVSPETSREYARRQPRLAGRPAPIVHNSMKCRVRRS